MNNLKNKRRRLQRRHWIVRKKVSGTKERPRLSVHRSLNHMYCQIIDDGEGKTLVALSTRAADLKGELKGTGNVTAAKILGKKLGEKALQAGIKKVVFDRGGYKYHGRVKAVSDGAREAGLEF